MNIIVLMAGSGNRFKIEGYNTIKPLIMIDKKPMIQWAIESLGIDGKFIFIINKRNGFVEETKKLLSSLVIDFKIIEIDYLTQGPASSCLLADKYIDNDESLLTINCDQIMMWDKKKINEYIENFKYDGFVVTYNTITEKNSYVKLDKLGNATEFAEKKIISNHSLNGIHYWSKGKYFVDSAKKMIEKNIRVNNEFYISQTYNELISEGYIIKSYEISKDEHWAVGTPDDLNNFLKNNIQ